MGLPLEEGFLSLHSLCIFLMGMSSTCRLRPARLERGLTRRKKREKDEGNTRLGLSDVPLLMHFPFDFEFIVVPFRS